MRVLCDECGEVDGDGDMAPGADVWCRCGREAVPVDPRACLDDVRLWLTEREAEDWLRWTLVDLEEFRKRHPAAETAGEESER